MDNTFTQTSSIRTTGPVTGMCTVEDGKIYELELYNQRQQIGVTNQVYEELKAICDNYYNKLVELKVIIPPKTPEEIQQETATMMSAMLEQMKQMQQRLEEVEHNAKSKAGIANGMGLNNFPLQQAANNCGCCNTCC